jgi:hypothetical protein
MLESEAGIILIFRKLEGPKILFMPCQKLQIEKEGYIKDTLSFSG